MKVALQSILATRNCCVANVVEQITTERKAAHGYFSDNNRSVTGNKKAKLKKYELSLSQVLTCYSQSRIGEKGKYK